MQRKMLGIFGAVLGSMLIWAGNAAAEERFNDLQYSKWAEDGIEYMAKRGTVAGYGDGKFKPAGLVTRAQAVTFLVRELYPEQLEKPAEGMTYSDVPKTHAFTKEIAIASKMDLPADSRMVPFVRMHRLAALKLQLS